MEQDGKEPITGEESKHSEPVSSSQPIPPTQGPQWTIDGLYKCWQGPTDSWFFL